MNHTSPLILRRRTYSSIYARHDPFHVRGHRTGMPMLWPPKWRSSRDVKEAMHMRSLDRKSTSLFPSPCTYDVRAGDTRFLALWRSSTARAAGVGRPFHISTPLQCAAARAHAVYWMMMMITMREYKGSCILEYFERRRASRRGMHTADLGYVYNEC